MMRKPNILLIISDDHRFDAIRAAGDPRVHTPNLDALIADGALFTHAHIPSGTSAAMCMPSRAMLHTGRTLFHIGGEGQRLLPEHTLLGETLRAAGYHTFGTGKWHNGPDAFNRSFADGDEIFFGGMGDHWNMPAFRYDPTGRYASRLPRCTDPVFSNKVEHVAADHIHAGKHSTDVIADSAIRFIEGYDKSAPWFAYAAFLAPHDPRTMPDRYRAMYDPDTVELPPNFVERHPFDLGMFDIRDEVLAPYPRTPQEIRKHIAEYYAMITHMDERIGDICNAIKARGEWDNTIIVYTADHGLAVGRHGLLGKQNLYDHSVRIPLILRGPGVPRGIRSDAFCYLMDVHPTLCALAGTTPAPSVEARSLVPQLRNPAAAGCEALFFAYLDLHRGVRVGDWKYMEYRVPGQSVHTQLFNLKDDPHEQRSLAEDPAQADRLRDLRARLRAEADRWDDGASPWGQQFWNRT